MPISRNARPIELKKIIKSYINSILLKVVKSNDIELEYT